MRLRQTAGGIGAVAHTAEDDFRRSFEVAGIDIFLSHSWHAWWVAKYLLLLFYFNGIPATIIASTVGLAIASHEWQRCPPEISGAERYGVSPQSHLFFLAGGATFFVVLLNWHHFACRTEEFKRTLFLDKVCIHQTDAKLKEQGIKSIGGILGRCNVLLVAWDPTYFFRLWCTYECSAFKYTFHNAHVEVLPVDLGSLVALLTCCVFLTDVFLIALSQPGLDVSLDEKRELYTMCWFLTSFLFVATLRRYVEDLHALDDQLSVFDVRNAECFCCGVGHVMPGTGATIPCDREVVEGSIVHWQNCADNPDEGLDNFDQLIRGSFKSYIRHTLGGSASIPYYMMVGVGVLPGLAQNDWSSSSNRPLWLRTLWYVDTTFFAFSIPIAIALAADYWSGIRPKSWCKKRFVELVLAILVSLLKDIQQRISIRCYHRCDRLTIGWLLTQVVLVWRLYFGRVRELPQEPVTLATPKHFEDKLVSKEKRGRGEVEMTAITS